MHSFVYSFPLWFIIMVYLYLIEYTVYTVLYNRTLLFIHSVYNSLHELTPSSQSIPPSPHLLATRNLFSMSATLFLFHR